MRSLGKLVFTAYLLVVCADGFNICQPLAWSTYTLLHNRHRTALQMSAGPSEIGKIRESAIPKIGHKLRNRYYGVRHGQSHVSPACGPNSFAVRHNTKPTAAAADAGGCQANVNEIISSDPTTGVTCYPLTQEGILQARGQISRYLMHETPSPPPFSLPRCAPMRLHANKPASARPRTRTLEDRARALVCVSISLLGVQHAPGLIDTHTHTHTHVAPSLPAVSLHALGPVALLGVRRPPRSRLWGQLGREALGHEVRRGG